MRMFVITLMLSLLAAGAARAQEDQRAEARRLAIEGVHKADARDFDGGLELLIKASQLDPDQPDYRYEQAYIYYAKGNYKKAAETIEGILDHPAAGDRWYQLLANSYDNMGEPEKALKIYMRGLKQFPNSGELHLELGVMSAKIKDYKAALHYWEEGIERDPAFPSNYYWATKAYSGGNNRIWALMYGEMFMNLESNSQRSHEISALLLETYRKSIWRSGDTVHVNVGEPVMVAPKKGEKVRLPFTFVYTTDLSLSTVGPLDHKADSVLTIALLNRVRAAFIDNWYKQKHDAEYPNVLFDWQKKLIADGVFEGYNYWLFSGGTQESRGWAAEHKDAFAGFGKWFSSHSITVDSTNSVSRARLEPGNQ